MKKTVPAILILFLFVASFCSCSSSKEAIVERKVALANSKITESELFVQFYDGTIKSYSSLQLVTGIYKSPHLLADGKLKIFPGEILAYQNKKHFAVSAAGFSYGGHKSNLAVETLPGFAVRIAAGKLNVYVKKYLNNSRVVDEFFLQEGNGQILVYTPDLMDALIKNNPEALDFFNNNRNKMKLNKQLKNTARIFNDTYFMAKASKKRN